MEGRRQLDAAEAEAVAAAVLLAVDFLDALLAEPLADLVVGDHGCPGALGDRDGVAEVIAVAVRDQDEIGLHVGGLRRGGRVVRQERVDEEVGAAG